ncbi:MAG: hypothetical protein ACRD16_01430, partial [Thermoanaerobaculia bacterium]
VPGLFEAGLRQTKEPEEQQQAGERENDGPRAAPSATRREWAAAGPEDPRTAIRAERLVSDLRCSTFRAGHHRELSFRCENGVCGIIRLGIPSGFWIGFFWFTNERPE